MPCQLKYRKVMIAQASGTVYALVGAVRNGNAPNKLPSRTNSAMEPTIGM